LFQVKLQAAPVAPLLASVLAAPAVRADWESERERLYQQLDNKVGLLLIFQYINLYFN
jgi:hypothetical protein